MPVGTARRVDQVRRARRRPRGQASPERQACLLDRQAAARADFDWLVPPVLNPTTRLAMMAEPAGGRLVARGFEADGPATEVLRLEGSAAA